MSERGAMWEIVFETYYDAFFEELASESLSRRWQMFDEIAKVIIALAASGSAVAGWALWNLPGWRLIWASFAGGAALVSIIHATLKVSDRVGRFEESRQAFLSVRNRLETLRCEMRLDHDFSVPEIRKRWLDLREEYGQATERIRSDLLRSKRFLEKTQDALNVAIADQLQEV
ncbi:hypothetical protein KAH43_06420 [Candidatus Bipolaricaulota bacterium]|nr:hypothetical protein [Candidatus Bipolaricaulota bacterium]